MGDVINKFLLRTVNNKDESLDFFFACLGAIKLIKNGWETEAIPKMSGKYTEKKGFFAKIFGIK